MGKIFVNCILFGFYGYGSGSLGYHLDSPIFWIGVLILLGVQINNGIDW